MQKPANSPAMWVGLVVIVILVVAGGWYFFSKDKTSTNTNVQVNTNTATGTTYSNTALGFQVTLPPTWATTDTSGFTADVVFQSVKAKDCGCAVYVKREDNDTGLSAEEWLASNAPSNDNYISQAEYDRRRSTGSESEKQQAGTYKQSTSQLGGQSAVVQDYQTEGGGYIRYLVSHASSIYALTLWSDSYYFNDSTKQNQFDGGQLKGGVDVLVSSFTFLQ